MFPWTGTIYDFAGLGQGICGVLRCYGLADFTGETFMDIMVTCAGEIVSWSRGEIL